MGRFAVRIRAIGPLAGSARLWRALVSGCAVALLFSVDIIIPADLSAQTILPSQVTPPTLRPPAAGRGLLTAPGAEDLRVLPDTGTKKRNRSKVFDRTNGATGNTGVSR
jgi:hypothetical protein